MSSLVIQEITLAVFTALAPAGTWGTCVLAMLLLQFDRDDETRKKLTHLLILPLSIVIIGLVASATHLGNPANALYLFRGVGRSPLSTEIFFALLFIFLSGMFWLYSFKVKTNRSLRRIWLVLIVLSSLAFLVTMAKAYSVLTILSWNTWHVPATIVANAITGGSLLALLTLLISRINELHRSSSIALLILVVGSAVTTVLIVLLQAYDLTLLGAAAAKGTEFFSWIYVMLILFCVCVAVASILGFIEMFVAKEYSRSILRLAIAAFLALLGIFFLRCSFYAIHMTVGF